MDSLTREEKKLVIRYLTTLQNTVKEVIAAEDKSLRILINKIKDEVYG